MTINKITLLTLGSHGDILPYVALGVGLKDAGYKVTIAANDKHKEFITRYGLDFFSLKIDFDKILREKCAYLYVSNNPYVMLQRMKNIVDPLRKRICEKITGIANLTNAIILHPSVYHWIYWTDVCRNSLKKMPYFITAFTPMFSPTKAFPCYRITNRNLGQTLNKISYYGVDIGDYFINHVLFPIYSTHSRRINISYLQTSILREVRQHSRIFPILYFYSRYVVPPVDDSSVKSTVTGYWFLPPPKDYKLPQEILNFLKAGEPPIYIGFGSSRERDVERATNIVITALKRTKKRGIINLSGGGMVEPAKLPSTISMYRFTPYAYLFPYVQAIIHHGGVGTAHEAIRSGKPSFICWHGIDHRFLGERVFNLGIGPRAINHRKLSVNVLVEAIQKMTSDQAMIRQAKAIGDLVKNEQGVQEAVKVINQSFRQL